MKPTVFLKFLGLGCILLVGVRASTQTSLGVKAGINVTSIATDSGYIAGGITNAIGLHGALLVEFGLSDHFAVQPELSFIQKGYRNDVVGVDWLFNQADLHLLAKFKYDIGEKFRGHLAAGPTFGAVLSGNRFPDDGDKVKIDLDAEQIKQWDYGICAGLGFGLELGPGVLFIDGRYMLSLDNIFEDSANKGKTRRVGFDYTLGYLFAF